MKQSLLLAEFANTPWALHPAAMHKLLGVLTRWNAGLQASPEVMAAIAVDKQAREARRQAATQASASNGGGIAVLPLYGVITQRGNMADDVSGPGSCSVQQFTSQFRAAIADPSVGQVLIDFDSPGGSVYGVDELASEIYQARGKKPVIGISNALCASAAYYVASQCDELYCTPSGEVGSIGVYTAHMNMSKAMEDDGVAVSLISAGKYKVEANPYGPLDDEARAAIQASVDGYYSMFTKAVARGRGVSIGAVRDGMGQARCLSATDSLTENMIDGVASFDDVIKGMQKNMRTGRTSASAEVMTVAHGLDTPPVINRLAQARRALQIASA